MSLAHRDLQTFRRKLSANWSRALILGTLLFCTLNSSWAQDEGALPTGKTNPPYPAQAEITFQWNYTCPKDRACIFRCPGAGGFGGADHLSRLDIYLGTLPTSSDEEKRALAIFYDFSSREFPHSNGFSISTGINTLSCQVSGMDLNYSGAPPKKSKPASPGDTPMSQLGH
jgi:hypothetical protein